MTTLIPKFDFKNGGTTPAGAINRTINQKLAESVSVLDFGADPTGATDSSSAIQAALNSLVTGNPHLTGVLTFPKGQYLINNQITIPSDNIIIDGEMSQIVARVGNTGSVFFANSTSGVNLNITIKNFLLEDTATGTLPISAKAFAEFSGGGFLQCKVNNITAIDVAYSCIVALSNNNGGLTDSFEISNILGTYAGQTPIAVWISAASSYSGVAPLGSLQISNVVINPNSSALNIDNPVSGARGSGPMAAVLFDKCSSVLGTFGPFIYSSGNCLLGRSGAFLDNCVLNQNYAEITSTTNLPSGGVPVLFAGLNFTNCRFQNNRLYYTPANWSGQIVNGVLQNCVIENTNITKENGFYSETDIFFQLSTNSAGNIISNVTETNSGSFSNVSTPINSSVVTKAPIGTVLYPQTNSLGVYPVTSVFNTQITGNGTTTLFTIPNSLIENKDIFVIRGSVYTNGSGATVNLSAFGVPTAPILLNNTLGTDGLFEIYVTFLGTYTRVNQIVNGLSANIPAAVITRAMLATMNTSPYSYGVTPGWINGFNSTGTSAGQQQLPITNTNNQVVSITVSGYTAPVYVKQLVVEQYKGNFQTNI